jgi:alcohol dehydrogenase (cytochrome c)
MIRAFQATLLIGFAILAAGGGALAQAARGPSTENLLKADSDSTNWMLPARSYSGNREVEESEIGPQNLNQLKVAWTFMLPGSDPVETAPIVWDGIVYVTSGQDDVFALDAKTGEVKWQYKPKARHRSVSHATVASPYTMGWSSSA